MCNGAAGLTSARSPYRSTLGEFSGSVRAGAIQPALPHDAPAATPVPAPAPAPEPATPAGLGYAEVAATLDLIEQLAPAVVIPGHGSVFTGVADSLAVARQRLDSFVARPERHTRHAAKVLLKYKLLEMGTTSRTNLMAWAHATPMLATLHGMLFPADRGSDFGPWLDDVLADLVRSGAVGLDGETVFNR